MRGLRREREEDGETWFAANVGHPIQNEKDREMSPMHAPKALMAIFLSGLIQPQANVSKSLMDLGKHILRYKSIVGALLDRLFRRSLHCIAKKQVVRRADPNLDIPTV